MGVLLLLAAGVLALIAGVVWGVVTASPSRQRPPGGIVGTPTPAGPVPAAEQAQYRATSVRVSSSAGGLRVAWASPSHTAGITAFIVVAEFAGRPEQEHTVGPAAHSSIFAGLPAGQRYCYVVGTLVELAGGRAGTAAAAPVCAVTPGGPP